MALQWSDVEVFLAVAEKKTLSQAAGYLNVSIPTVTRRIDALEKELGVKLLRRTIRGATLTEAGNRALEDARAGARHMKKFTRAAKAALQNGLRIPIRISSTEPMISRVLAPNLGSLLEQIPDVGIEFDIDTGLSDLTWGDIDIAVRLARPQIDSYVGRALKKIELSLYCSKRYLRRRDPLALNLDEEELLWLDAKYQGIPENLWLVEHQLESRARLRSGSIRALEEACLAGIGIAPLPRFSAPPSLVEVAGPSLPPRQPWVVFHKDTRSNKRMRVVRDWIVQSCEAVF